MNDIYRGKRAGIGQASLIFSITIALFIFIGFRVQAREFYSGILITEFGLILLPGLLFLLLNRCNLKSVLRLNGIKPVNFLIIFVIMLLAIPLVAVFNFLNLLLVKSIFGTVMAQQIPIAENGRELLLNLLVIAGSAGICEEVLFRGVIQRSYERLGAVKAILLAAFLFSLTHLDFQKLFGTFLLGALIGFFVYRTNSLYSGMFAHFTNNALVVLITYGSNKLMSMFQDSGISSPAGSDINELFSVFAELPKEQLIIVFFVYGIMLLFLAVLFILLLYAFCRINPPRQKSGAEMTEKGAEAVSIEKSTDTERMQEYTSESIGMNGLEMTESKNSGMMKLIWLLPGLTMIAVIFVMQASSLLGVEMTFIEVVKGLLF